MGKTRGLYTMLETWGIKKIRRGLPMTRNSKLIFKGKRIHSSDREDLITAKPIYTWVICPHCIF